MPSNREGTRVPEVVFRTRRDEQWVAVNSKEVFSGKNVVCFALPGAFTPTCSSSHLPRYNELVEEFRAAGIDEIVCISVNDAFVMDAWKRTQGADRVTLLPDGNGEFTEKMGMLVDKADLGFGLRSWRYSMLVRDGVIEKMFVEPRVPGDPFEVSDADTMLRYLRPATRSLEDITVLTKPGCPHCARAKVRLRAEGKVFEEIVLGREISSRTLRAVSGAHTVPQIFIDGVCIGGADDLEAYFDRLASAGPRHDGTPAHAKAQKAVADAKATPKATDMIRGSSRHGSRVSGV